MQDWKTTITGLLTAVLAFASQAGYVIPEKWGIFILAIGAAIGGFLSKDSSS
jgi:hypothetical protein